MADEPIQDKTPAPAAGDVPAVTRPEFIPETIWDSEKNAPKIDLAATLTEHDTMKAAAAERAAKIPAKPDDYKFDLPKDFEIPAGMTWKADPAEPLVAAFRDYAVENKLTQDEVQGVVKLFAANQVQELKAREAFDAEQTKALGANAEQRRGAVTTWMKGALNPQQASILSTLLPYKDGVEALEAVMKKAGSLDTRGNGGESDQPDKNTELAENVGKKGGAMALLRAGNAK